MDRLFATSGLRALVWAGFAAAIALPGCNQQKPPPKEEPPSLRVYSPAWYEDSPVDDEGRIRKTAQGVAQTVSLSEAMAVNRARQEMALAIESRVDVLQRSFREQIDTSEAPELLQRFQDANEIVASRVLHGSNVIRKETYRADERGGFRTYVLMELDPRMVDAMYLERLRQIELLETRLRSTELWKDLERKARELRRERGAGVLPPMTDEEISGDEL